MNGVGRADRYVRHVLKKPHLYPVTIRQACERYNADKLRDDVYLDESAANYVITVVETMPHTKGSQWQGKPMFLEDWQCFFYVNVFGWKLSDTKLRRFRYADLFVPRKNGKTAMAIPAALLMLAVDREKGAEVFLGTTSQEDARELLLKPAKYICDFHQEFAEKFNIKVNASSIITTDNDSSLATVIREPKDGRSPHFALCDELHEHKDDKQYNTFRTGMGARLQPILMVISTAGTDLLSPCKSQMDKGKKILNGSFSADNHFAMMFIPDDGDEWDDVKTLRKVNPNMGVSVSEKFLLEELENAKQSPKDQNTFKTKHVNIWCGASSAWMDMDKWNKQKTDLKIDDFAGEDCHLTCDLASTIDVAAIHATFRRGDDYYSFPFFYVPNGALKVVDEYSQFQNAGHLTVTDGDMTDYAYLEREINDLATRFNVLSVSFDPHQATYLQTRLRDGSLNDKVFDLAMNRNNLSEPMNELEGRVAAKQYWHDDNSCMNWMIGNTCNAKDAGERSYPVKENRNDNRCHIDGSITAIMGVARWLDEEEDKTSVYEERGVRRL